LSFLSRVASTFLDAFSILSWKLPPGALSTPAAAASTPFAAAIPTFAGAVRVA
jgi:hypothetical protein